MTHDASIQSIDESNTNYQTVMGTELNFRDTWGTTNQKVGRSSRSGRTIPFNWLYSDSD